MRVTLIAAALICLLPAAARAAAAVPSSENIYLANPSIIVTAPVAGDLAALGGSIVSAAPIAGDGLFCGGSVSARAPIAGDLRVLGGTVAITAPVAGDVVASGISVSDTARAGQSAFVAAVHASLTGGSAGPVTIYGNDVSLGGTFDGDVRVTAMGRVRLSPGTVIHGSLSYESPERATIPASAVIDDGVTYTSASYLPNPGTSHVLAVVSLGFFLIFRILGAILLAGILAGLFPRLASMIVDRAAATRLRGATLTTLLGFGVAVATPVLVLLLALTFVGFGLAALLFLLYALFVLLAFLYAGITLGGLAARRFLHRRQVAWHDGVLGMAVFSLISLVPYLGLPLIALAVLFSLGTLVRLALSFAFPGEDT
jgi:cytoskeletal protein CcmA (bactofilin family)